MNVGTARYWILVGNPPVLLEATNDVYRASTAASNKAFDVIDRGPINQWTGQPHPPQAREAFIKEVERVEALINSTERSRSHGLEELDLDEDRRHPL